METNDNDYYSDKLRQRYANVRGSLWPALSLMLLLSLLFTPDGRHILLIMLCITVGFVMLAILILIGLAIYLGKLMAKYEEAIDDILN